MRDTRFKNRSSEFVGDMAVWTKETAEDNTQRLERMRRNLLRARQTELTPRQREFLDLYYDCGYSMARIAELTGVHRSTVCRTLHRAEQKLQHILRYTV